MADIEITETRDDQIQFRSSRSLKRKLKQRAKDQGMSLTKLILLSLMASNPELREDILAEL